MSCFMDYGSTDANTGGKVSKVQNALNKNGASLLVDGLYYSETRKAVQNFQRRKSLTIDCVGPLTWNALGLPPIDPDNRCHYSPRYLKGLKQGTDYWCGPFLSMQVVYEITGRQFSQSEIAEFENTNDKGTPPARMKEGIESLGEKYGLNLNVSFQPFDSVSWSKIADMVEAPNIGLGFHELYKQKWGHWEYPCIVCLDSSTVYMVNSLDRTIDKRSFDTMKNWIQGVDNAYQLLIVEKS